MADSFNSLDKSELMHRKGPWRIIEWALLNYVDWFNFRRTHESLDYAPPVESEAHRYDTSESESPSALKRIALYKNRGEPLYEFCEGLV